MDKSIDKLVQFHYGQKYRQTCTVSLWTKVHTDLYMTLDRCTDMCMTMDRCTDRHVHDD